MFPVKTLTINIRICQRSNLSHTFILPIDQLYIFNPIPDLVQEGVEPKEGFLYIVHRGQWTLMVSNLCYHQEPTETSKQPIRTHYLDHVTGNQPIRTHYLGHVTGRDVPSLSSGGGGGGRATTTKG
eukprot:sb/3475605/